MYSLVHLKLTFADINDIYFNITFATAITVRRDLMQSLNPREQAAR